MRLQESQTVTHVHTANWELAGYVDVQIRLFTGYYLLLLRKELVVRPELGGSGQWAVGRRQT